MKKTRRKNSVHIEGAVFPVWVLAALLVAATLCLAYVWCKGRSQGLGVRIKTLERELAEVNKVYANELLKWENMKSPSNVERALARYNINMIWPPESAIVRLHDPKGVELSIDKLNGEVAATAPGRTKIGGRP